MKEMLRFTNIVLTTGAVLAACHLEAAEKEITQVTRSGPVVSQPKTIIDNHEMYYGLGFPVQVGPKKAALFCNLAVRHNADYEAGGDIYLFDSLEDFGKREPTPITRLEKEKDSKTGEPRFILKFPPCPGFWPLGAKRQDGTPHPGAGKGFAFGQALSLLGDGDKITADMYKTAIRYLEIMQVAFDGQQISVTERSLIKPGQGWVTTNGWNVYSPGLQTAIPDRDDLLLALTASSKKEGLRTGVCRFRFSEGQWRPLLFTPVNGGVEPSVARRADGSFIFTARTFGYNNVSESIELWAAKDVDGPWSQHLRSDNQRAQAPPTVHATTDGIIFVLSSPTGMTSVDRKVKWSDMRRVRLALWQLDQDEAKFNPPRPWIIRDGPQEFGRVDGDRWGRWVLDHPVSAVVQLGDGLWHCLVAYRVQCEPFIKSSHLGCYIQEVITAQPKTPPWRF